MDGRALKLKGYRMTIEKLGIAISGILLIRILFSYRASEEIENKREPLMWYCATCKYHRWDEEMCSYACSNSKSSNCGSATLREYGCENYESK